MINNQKPIAKLIGENGNIFNIIALASQALRSSGQKEQINKMEKEVMSCLNYTQALAIISEYVEIE